jgi:hypothetical protein
MAEMTQYSFDMSEVTEALIKQQGIHEGLWMAGFEFMFTAALAGPTPIDARPSAVVSIGKMLLMKPQEGVPETPLIVDAAKVNPAPSAPKKKVRATADKA